MKTSILLNRFFRLCCTMLVISAFLGGCDAIICGMIPIKRPVCIF